MEKRKRKRFIKKKKRKDKKGTSSVPRQTPYSNMKTRLRDPKHQKDQIGFNDDFNC